MEKTWGVDLTRKNASQFQVDKQTWTLLCTQLSTSVIPQLRGLGRNIKHYKPVSKHTKDLKFTRRTCPVQSLIPYKTASGSLWAFSPVLETPEGIFTAKLLWNTNILRGCHMLDRGRVWDEQAQDVGHQQVDYGISDCPNTQGSMLDFPGLFPYVSKENISNDRVNFGDFRENTSWRKAGNILTAER